MRFISSIIVISLGAEVLGRPEDRACDFIAKHVGSEKARSECDADSHCTNLAITRTVPPVFHYITQDNYPEGLHVVDCRKAVAYAETLIKLQPKKEVRKGNRNALRRIAYLGLAAAAAPYLYQNIDSQQVGSMLNPGFQFGSDYAGQLYDKYPIIQNGVAMGSDYAERGYQFTAPIIQNGVAMGSDYAGRLYENFDTPEERQAILDDAQSLYSNYVSPGFGLAYQYSAPIVQGAAHMGYQLAEGAAQAGYAAYPLAARVADAVYADPKAALYQTGTGILDWAYSQLEKVDTAEERQAIVDTATDKYFEYAHPAVLSAYDFTKPIVHKGAEILTKYARKAWEKVNSEEKIRDVLLRSYEVTSDVAEQAYHDPSALLAIIRDSLIAELQKVDTPEERQAILDEFLSTP